jgi:excisionase family DNA binding protein
MNNPCDNILLAKEVSSLLRCSLQHVYDLFHAGELRGFKDGRSVKVFKDSVEEYVRKRQNTPTEAPGAGKVEPAAAPATTPSAPKRRARPREKFTPLHLKLPTGTPARSAAESRRSG